MFHWNNRKAFFFIIFFKSTIWFTRCCFVTDTLYVFDGVCVCVYPLVCQSLLWKSSLLFSCKAQQRATDGNKCLCTQAAMLFQELWSRKYCRGAHIHAHTHIYTHTHIHLDKQNAKWGSAYETGFKLKNKMQIVSKRE